MKATTRKRKGDAPSRKRCTITFQPTDGVLAVVEAVIKDRLARKPGASGRIRSELINQAILVHFGDFVPAAKVSKA